MVRYAKTPPPLVLLRSTPKHRPERAPGRIHVAPKRLGPEAIQQLVVDYEAGESTAALAQTYGLAKGTVLDLLAKNGVQVRGQGLPGDQLEEATRLYVEDGWPLRRLGPHLGCSPDAVRLGLIRAGVTLRKPWERGPSQQL